MNKKNIINSVLVVVFSAAVFASSFFFRDTKSGYIISAVTAVFALVPFFVSFEKGKTKTREVAALASITAIAVVSRAAFYFLPQVKPIAAVVITAAAVFGCETGFITGALAMLLSNLIFGMGTYTPFQMLGLGLTAYVAGFLFESGKLRKNRFVFGMISGVLTFILYGFIVDTGSAMLAGGDAKAKLAVYAAGLPFNAIFGVTTAVVIIIFGLPLTEKLLRLKTKYGLFSKGEE